MNNAGPLPMQGFTMQPVNGLLNRTTHPVPMDMLPTKGIAYPDNIEISVSPLRIRERRQLEGVTQATYYEKLLEGVQILGGDGTFNKKMLLFADVQFLDLVRRVHSFELDKEIQIDGYECPHCGDSVKTSFMFKEIEFEDMNPDVFKTVKTMTDDETGEKVEVTLPGKIYRFSDGMEVVAAPLTIGEYIELSTKYLSNVSEKNLQAKLAEVAIAQFAYLIKDVPNQKFLSADFRRKFILDYIGDLYKVADENVLSEIEKETVGKLIPIKKQCPNCGAELEVYVQASLRFQQDI